MNRRINKIFAVIHNSQIVCIDNTLAGFHAQFKNMEPSMFGYLTLFKRFQKDDYFSLVIDNKTYHFQRIQ